VTANGVGSRCAEAVEEALAEALEITFFPGEATMVCRVESRE
jgi:hypothetical protein